MTDRVNALTVVLDTAYREDDVQPLVDAIQQLRGVQSVTLNVQNIEDHIAYSRARTYLTERLFEALKDHK